jgi:hypothetical protein
MRGGKNVWRLGVLATTRQDCVVQFIAGIRGYLRFGNRNIDRNSGSESFATRSVIRALR